MRNTAVVQKRDEPVLSGNALDEFPLEPEPPPSLLIEWPRSGHDYFAEFNEERARPRREIMFEVVRPLRPRAAAQAAPPPQRQGQNPVERLKVFVARFVEDTGPGMIGALIAYAIVLVSVLLQ